MRCPAYTYLNKLALICLLLPAAQHITIFFSWRTKPPSDMQNGRQEQVNLAWQQELLSYY